MKLSLFINDMMVYVQNLKEFFLNLTKLLNNYNKIVGYKMHKSKLFSFIPKRNKQNLKLKAHYHVH